MAATYSRRALLGLLATTVIGCAALPPRPTSSGTPSTPTTSGAASPSPAVARTPTAAATAPSSPTAIGSATPSVGHTPLPGLTPTMVASGTPIVIPSVIPSATTVSSASKPALPTPGQNGTTGLGAFPLPTRVRIPKIKVDALVETVGQEADGVMQKPSTPEVVAWYGYGSPPGWPGASVLAGHVDSVKGPAVFWSLQDLRAGDVVEVELLGHDVLRFVVDTATLYLPEAAPIDAIFAPSGPPRLNLITCGGVFDRSRHAYDHRLVVFTHPASSNG